jgi:inosose dehydratase
VVLHDRHHPVLGELEREAKALEASGAEVLVLAAALHGQSYDRDERLSGPDWVALGEALDDAEGIATRHGLRLAFHPHAGTAVARQEDVHTLLETTTVDICLDTGHLFLGGADAAAIARDASGRVGHVHLKDVDRRLAERVQSGELSYAEGVGAGLYRPLGQGGLDVEAVFARLEDAGYRGWYVLEQDTALTAEPEPAHGPVAAARQSIEYFRGLSSAPHQSLEGGQKR